MQYLKKKSGASPVSDQIIGSIDTKEEEEVRTTIEETLR
jgi:hypothetical protein